MTGDELMGQYLAEGHRRLPGSERERRRVLVELADGLLEATERHGRPDDPDAVRAAVREFGHASLVGAALADELRQRLVRRSTLTIAGVLVLVGVAWRTYAGIAGFPSSAATDSWAAPVFLTASDGLKVAPAVAPAAAVLLVVATSIRWLGGSLRLQRVLAQTVAVALIVCLTAVVAGVGTIATPHLPSASVAGAPTAGMMLAMLLLTWRALQQLGPAPPPRSGSP